MTTMSSSSERLRDPLVERLRTLTVARIVAVLGTVVALAPLTDFTDDRAGQLLALTSSGYLAANALYLLALRVGRRGERMLLTLSLVTDAAWASALLWLTGGISSPLIFLMYVQSAAVTVLFGWPNGIKLALLHTAGLLAVAYAQSQGLGGDTAAVSVGLFRLQLDPTRGAQVIRIQLVIATVSVWVVAVSTALFSDVRERELRRSNQELALLRELTTEFERSLDLADVCQAIASGVVQQLGYRRAVVWMADGTELRPAGTAGFDPEDLSALADLVLHVGPGPVGRAVEGRRPVLVAREHARPAALADAFAIDSPLVLVPLVTESRILGLLTVEVSQPVGRAPRVTGRDLRVLTTLATEASLALENARLHAELRDLSITDALTGVYNHRYFQQRLQEELDRAVRSLSGSDPQPVSLVLLDLDLFKKVNDRFGHQAGDDLLRAIARLLRRVLRSTDVICRYGGEEFAIILPATPGGVAVQVAERLREAIELSHFAASDGRYLGHVTGSFGVATYAQGIPSRAELIRQADTALYRAKRAGRNTVVAYSEEPPVPAAAERMPASGPHPPGW